MANTLKETKGNVICGLGTFTMTVTTAGIFMMSAVATEVPPSGLSITLAQSGSTSVSVTSTVLSATQNVLALQKLFNCAVSDVLTLTIASSTVSDEQLNTVKTLATAVRIQ